MNDVETRAGEETGPEAPKTEGLTTAAIAGVEASPPAGERRSFAEGEEGGAQPTGEEAAAPLFDAAETGGLRKQWDAIQTGFVDEPRRAVEGADALVASTMQRLAEIFAEERSRLEGQWDRGDDVSTEALRVALRRYRSFFTRLLSI